MRKQQSWLDEVETPLASSRHVSGMVALLKPFLGLPNPSLILEAVFGRRETSMLQTHFTEESSSLDAVMANLNRPNTAHTVHLLK